MRSPLCSYFGAPFRVLAVLLGVAAASGGAEIRCNQQWHAVFANSKHQLTFEVRSDKPVTGVAQWNYRVNDDRTIDRGQVRVRLDPGKPFKFGVHLRIPPVKDGVVWQSRLFVSLIANDTTRPVAELDVPVWIFTEDPFASRRTWFKQLKVHVYDPNGVTSTLLADSHLEYRIVPNLTSLETVADGVVLIGEGLSLGQGGELPQILVNAAKRGVRVICLAPTDGEFRLFNDEHDDRIPQQLILKRSSAISDLDKRLDAVAWPGIGDPSTTLGN